MGTWMTRTCVDTRPERVLSLLTDPSACASWSPVPFELRRLDGGRLTAGSRAQLAGRIAGREVAFEVDFLEADDRALSLRARGPFEIDARYEAVAGSKRTELRASVSIRGTGGFLGRLAAKAAEGMLAAGALDAAVYRIARAAESPFPAIAG
jgi:polyketide cyclase/dehydrase/lipid transport protein